MPYPAAEVAGILRRGRQGEGAATVNVRTATVNVRKLATRLKPGQATLGLAVCSPTFESNAPESSAAGDPHYRMALVYRIGAARCVACALSRRRSL